MIGPDCPVFGSPGPRRADAEFAGAGASERHIDLQMRDHTTSPEKDPDRSPPHFSDHEAARARPCQP